MRKNFAFTLVELLVVIAIIVLVATVIVIAMRDALAKARDSKRITEVDTLRKALALYYSEEGKYPEQTSWVCLEKDADENGNFSQEMKNWLPTIPRDPLYPQQKEPGHTYCYHYKTKNSGQEYKIHVLMEKAADYEVYSENGDEMITYLWEGSEGNPLPLCQGYWFNENCWYEGELGQSCVTVCESHNGNAGTCQENDPEYKVCKHFHPDYEHEAGSTGDYLPAYYEASKQCMQRIEGYEGSCTAASSQMRRFCACNESATGNEGEWVSPVNVYAVCGEEGGYEATKFIDGDTSTFWGHFVDELHWIVLDLGESMPIEKVRSWVSDNNPSAWETVEIYISDDPENWGVPVASNASFIWQTGYVAGWSETDIIDKTGRYIKLDHIDTRDGGNSLRGYEFAVYVPYPL